MLKRRTALVFFGFFKFRLLLQDTMGVINFGGKMVKFKSSGGISVSCLVMVGALVDFVARYFRGIF